MISKHLAKKLAILWASITLSFSNIHFIQAAEAQSASILDVTVFSKNKLDLEIQELENGKHEFTLTYSGNGLVDVKLLQTITTIFQIPQALMDVIDEESIHASYSVPIVQLLGIPIYDRDTFSPDDIHTNKEWNQISVDSSQVLTLRLLSFWPSYYTLKFTVDEIPLSPAGVYQFYASAVRSNELIKIDLLNLGSQNARVEMDVDQPTITPPILHPSFSGEKVITGIARPNSMIWLEVEDQSYGVHSVDAGGNFQVEVAPLTEGAEIKAWVEVYDLTSEPAIAYVLKRPDQPEITPIYSNDTQIKGEFPESADEASFVVIHISDDVYYTERNGNEFLLELDMPLVAGTPVEAVHIDTNYYQSFPSTAVVEQARLMLREVPDSITFDPITIGTEPILVFPNKPVAFTIQDTYGSGHQWRLIASITEPLTSTQNEQNQLINALGFVYTDNVFQPLTKEAISISEGMTTSHQPFSLDWPNDQGVALYIKDMSTVYAEEYRTTIKWVLTDAP